jgi:hypothetical protein
MYFNNSQWLLWLKGLLLILSKIFSSIVGVFLFLILGVLPLAFAIFYYSLSAVGEALTHLVKGVGTKPK